MHWEQGKALTFDTINTYLHHAFRAASDAGTEAAHQQLLTAREREILGLMAAGMTNPQIAAQLMIGAGTVKTHTLNIYRKLEVANRTQAIVRAQELGLLTRLIPSRAQHILRTYASQRITLLCMLFFARQGEK